MSRKYVGTLTEANGENKSQLLRPLSARQVYKILRAFGREDAIPEGRIITNGLAAITGWALGFTKALGAVFIYDIITANVTADMLNETEGQNSGNVAAAVTPNSVSGGTVQEVCFNTRQPRSVEEAEVVAAFYTHNGYSAQHRRNAQIRKSVKPRRNKKRRRNKFRGHNGLRLLPQRIRNGQLLGTTNSIGAPLKLGIETISGTGTLTIQPTTTSELLPNTYLGAPTGTISDIGTRRRDAINIITTGTGVTNDITTMETVDNIAGPYEKIGTQDEINRTKPFSVQQSQAFRAPETTFVDTHIIENKNKIRQDEDAISTDELVPASSLASKDVINCIVLQKG